MANQRKLLISYAKKLKAQKYQSDPIAWQVERFGEPVTNWYWSKWGEKYDNHIWDGTKDPFATAIKALSDGFDVAIEAATGVGKTYTAAKIAYWFLDAFPNSAVITTAPTKEQLIQVLWKEIGESFDTYNRINSKAEILTGEVRANKALKYSEDLKKKDYRNRIISKVGRKRSGEDSSVVFQGIHNIYQLFIIDEAAGIEHSVVKSIRNTNTAKADGMLNVILALGNPDSQTDTLHDFSQKPNVKHIIISAYDHPNIVLNNNLIHGSVTTRSIEERKDEYKEGSNFYNSRVRGISPSEGVNSLFKDYLLNKCYIHHEDYFDNDSIKQESSNAVGVDAANSVDGDKACVAYGKGKTLVYLKEFSCLNSNFLAYNLVLNNMDVMKRAASMDVKDINKLVYDIPTLKDYDVGDFCIGVDSVGIGAGTLNTLNELEVKAIGLHGGANKEAYISDENGKYLYEFENLRAQMYYQAMLDLQNSEIVIDIPERVFSLLKKELLIIDFELSNNSIKIEDKKKIKKKLGGKSPNYADSFVYWNWMRRGWYKSKFWVN